MPDTITQSILNRQRSNKFILILDLPDKLKKNDKYELKNIQFTIIGGNFIPDIRVNSSSLPYAGQFMQVPNFTRIEYGPVQIKFKLDNEWKNYLTIYHWINLFNHYKTGVFDENNELSLSDKISVAKSYKEYTHDISILILDEYNNPVIKFTYTNAYPTDLTGFEPTYKNGEEIECSASFRYNQFIPEKQ